MRQVTRLILVLAMAASTAFMPANAQTASSGYSEEECHVSGVWNMVRCYSLERPLFEGSSETLTLGGVILPSDAVVPEADPLLILTGGPGQAATDMVSMMRSLFRDTLRTRDLIFFDIRGTGMSNPVSCIKEDETTDNETRAKIDLDLIKSELQECYQEHGAKLQGATTKMAVADIDALRQALGIEQYNIWGVSYGTRLAQYYINEHESHVRSAILDGVVPFAPSYISETPTYALQALNKVTADCAASAACANAFPDFDPIALLDQIPDEQSVTYAHPVTNEAVTLETDRDYVAQVIFSALYSPQSRAYIPYVLTEATANNNWGPLAVLADDPNRYFGIQTIYAGARFSIVCSEEQANLNSLITATNAFQSGATIKSIFKAACDGWPMVNEPLPAPKDGAYSVPTLLISGALDPITPPVLAEHSVKYFTNAEHIILENGAHFNSHVPCISDYLTGFIADLNEENPELKCIGDGYRPDFIVGVMGSVAQGEAQ